MRQFTTCHGADGTTEPKLLMLVGIVGLAALLIWGLTPTRTWCGERAPSMRCASNLKQAGLGFIGWAQDHENRFPWQVTIKAGGSMEYIWSAEVFRHYSTLSNWCSPKAFVCPADTRRKPAKDFRARFDNNNVSYFVGLDAAADCPESFLAGDRNITGEVWTNGHLRMLQSGKRVQYDHTMHRGIGKVVLADGSVQSVASHQLNRLLEKHTNEFIRLAVP